METDLTRRTVKQLTEQLRSLGLTPIGNKHNLIQQILRAVTSKRQTSFPTGIIDIDREVLLNLDIFDLLRTCKTNTYVNKLCNNENFLLLRLQLNYKGNANKALIEAAEYGDLPFVKYLVKMHNVSFSFGKFDEYAAFLGAYSSEEYKISKYLVENMKIDMNDLYNLVKRVINDEDENIFLLQYIIEESGIVNKLIGAGKNIMDTYNKLIGVAKEKKFLAAHGYLTMMRYLYEYLDKSTYLKTLSTLSLAEERKDDGFRKQYGYEL